MSQTNQFHIPNLAGAPFRNLLNQILAALSEQNSGSTEPTNPFAGMVWLDTSTNPSIFKLRNDGNTGWIEIFTTQRPPTKAQVGLGNVPNYSATSSLTDDSMTKFLLAAAGKQLNDSKLDKSAAAADALKLGGKLASQYVLISGTYANLRAQATTKADVGLGSVQNYGITSSLTSNNSALYLSAKGGYDLNQMKVNKTTTINGQPLTSNVSLNAADVNALPAAGGNLGGPINFTPDTGDIIQLDGKTVLRRISQAGGISLGAADALIIGCGEARQTLEDNVSATSELIHMGSDGAIHFYTNLQSGWAARKGFTFEADGGFMPANAEKTRQNLDVPKVGDSYLKSETYDQSQVDSKIPVTGYALLNFGTVTTRSRYVLDNPFGADVPVLCFPEVQVDGGWYGTPVTCPDSSGSMGVFSGSVHNEGVVLRTAWYSLLDYEQYTANLYPGHMRIHTAACRVHVWRLGV